VIGDDSDRGRVRNGVLAVTALAWVLSMWTPAATPHHHGADVLSAGVAAKWLLMLSAMMAPALIAPIRFVRGNGFARRRTRSSLLFVLGYTALWMLVGAALWSVAAALQASIVSPSVQLAAGLLIALVWQCSPAKQVALNRCHARPALAAFGGTADRDAVTFGMTHGAWCAASCWAWMLVPLLAPAAHIAVMAIATVLIFCERLDNPAPPAWRWRGLGKARRIVVARLSLRLRAAAATSIHGMH
jgi:predicted metal-binding membrane protein